MPNDSAVKSLLPRNMPLLRNLYHSHLPSRVSVAPLISRALCPLQITTIVLPTPVPLSQNRLLTPIIYPTYNGNRIPVVKRTITPTTPRRLPCLALTIKLKLITLIVPIRPRLILTVVSRTSSNDTTTDGSQPKTCASLAVFRAKAGAALFLVSTT